MNTLFWVVIILVFVFFAFRMMPIKGVQNITSTELKNMLKNKDKQFIDVRTPVEYQENKIIAFQNIPLHELRTRLHHLSKEKETVLICQSGMRSQQAAKMLKKAGFQQIYNVAGGMNSWN
ncbi:MAG TPA: rhodanese-like domain-containing protein [Candidatus Avamphibacillus sp.]|nr:rhodanese-like domain-containing protein [Candidatus Avamphibacillus sp.]